jgi:hypothetical protein
MKKILVIFIVFLSFNTNLFADESDYIVGLNAYKDGFYDIAKISLEDFVKTSKNKANINYSKYLLYQIYLSEKKYDEAEKLFNQIIKINDKRFDKKIIRRDQVRFLIKDSKCNEAAKIVKKYPEEATARLFVFSKCKFDNELYKVYLNNNIPENLKIKALFKSSENNKAVSELFSKIKLKSFTDEEKNYLAKYFYKHKDFDQFWKIYNEYKDDDLVNLALNRVWDIKNYDSFIRSFEINSKNYKISSANSCRALSIYSKNKQDFQCDLIESCYVKKDANYHRSMLACLLKKKDKEKIKDFIDSVQDNNFKYICEYSEFLIANDYYDLQGIHRFSTCKQVNDLADILIDKKKPNAILKLFSGKSTNKAYFYITKAYMMKGDNEKAKLFKDKITDKKLIEAL